MLNIFIKCNSGSSADYLIMSTSNFKNLYAINVETGETLTTGLLQVDNVTGQYNQDLRGLAVVCYIY